MGELRLWLPVVISLAAVAVQAGIIIAQMRAARAEVERIRMQVDGFIKNLPQEYVTREVWTMAERSHTQAEKRSEAGLEGIEDRLRGVEVAVAKIHNG